MAFGDFVDAASDPTPAAWIDVTRRGEWGTVGSLVPNHFESVARVPAPAPPTGGSDDWWSAYRTLVGTVAEVGAAHTSTPNRAWFTVWDGHGFATGATLYSTDLSRWRRARLRRENERRNARIRASLRPIPRIELPNRAYYLVTGPVAAATEVRDPSQPERWQRPDLWWPDDRAWFVATDVDFWSLYIGGDKDFITDVARSVTTPVEWVGLDHPLKPER